VVVCAPTRPPAHPPTYILVGAEDIQHLKRGEAHRLVWCGFPERALKGPLVEGPAQKVRLGLFQGRHMRALLVYLVGAVAFAQCFAVLPTQIAYRGKGSRSWWVGGWVGGRAPPQGWWLPRSTHRHCKPDQAVGIRPRARLCPG
jgi:hypothetical protein